MVADAIKEQSRAMARCNHLLAVQLPATAALLANIASVSAWSGRTSASLVWHPSLQRKNCHLRTSSSSSVPSSSAFCRRHQSIPHFGGSQHRGYSLASTGRSDGISEHNIISSVRDSLRYDIVQSHLDGLSASPSNKNTNRDTNNNDTPTLVLVLAVSGGCDSIGLFHAILALTKPDQQQTTNEKINDESGSTNNPPCMLYLGDSAKAKDDHFRIPCELHVAHFNHEQRGENSDGDEALVKRLCGENGIPVHSYYWSDEEFTSTSKSEITDEQYSDDNNSYDTFPIDETTSPESFTQDVARKWRRRRLQELLSKLVVQQDGTPSGSDTRWGAILTAHHRDDADETILLKLLRGSHLTNLRSMDAISDGFDLQLAPNSEKKNNFDAPSQSSFVGYFAKPMLNIRKNDVTEYLTSNSLEWREDESNSSNKYKRNKVRNKLMPLLSEIAGGEYALQKRLSNLEHQSRDISRDLSQRSEEYLQTMPSGPAFHLAKEKIKQFDLVQEEGLHMWIMKVTNRELQLSYDQMLRIRSQLHDYPERLQWVLDVGSCWKLQRNGDTLVAIKETEKNQDGLIDDAPALEKALPWKIIRPKSDSDDDDSAEMTSSTEELCFTSLAESSGYSQFELQRVKDCGNIKFTPPWRRGRSSIKIKEFLRGQKVPLHRRDEAIILFLSDDSTRHALAVYLEGTGDDDVGKWIVNAGFSPQDDLPVTKVVLGKTSLP